jgi:recombination associated protein RdgC
MLKTITVFKMNRATKQALSPENMQATIPEPTVVDPSGSQWRTIGFSRPDEFGETTVFVGASNIRLFNVQIRERVLPGKVIRKALAERAEEIGRRQGYKPNRKQMAELKDELIAAMLPTAFIKPVDVLCMITKDYLIVGTGSASVVDEIVKLICQQFEQHDLRFEAISRDRKPGRWMTELLLNGTTESGKFNCGQSVVLKGEGKSTARFKDIDLQSERISEHVAAGMSPVELSIITKNNDGEDRVMFTLSDQMVLKRVTLSDVLTEDVKDDAGGDDTAYFDATVALVGGEIRRLLDDLLTEIPQQDDEEEL